MGGSSRGERISYAAVRPGGAEAVAKDKEIEDRQRRLDDGGKTKVFYSYQYKQDVQKVNLIRHQGETSYQYQVQETSSRERYPDNWKPHALRDIKSADEYVMVVGKETYKSESVEWEAEKAIENDKPILVIKTAKDVKVPKVLSQEQYRTTSWNLNRMQQGIDKDQEDVSYGENN